MIASSCIGSSVGSDMSLLLVVDEPRMPCGYGYCLSLKFRQGWKTDFRSAQTFPASPVFSSLSDRVPDERHAILEGALLQELKLETDAIREHLEAATHHDR